MSRKATGEARVDYLKGRAKQWARWDAFEKGGAVVALEQAAEKLLRRLDGIDLETDRLETTVLDLWELGAALREALEKVKGVKQ